MITIQNEILSATINPKGAELVSLIDKPTNTEYMWSADPKYWGKSSPVLFPVIGSLKGNSFIYDNQEYALPRHGFARDRVFKIEKLSESSVVFLLTEDDSSLQVFPFTFELRLHYSTEANQLKLKYEVKNTGNNGMFFSIGGHPAFKVPFAEGTTYNDYFLEFNKVEDLKKWPLDKDGLIESEPETIADDSGILPLTKELFYQDALVFKHLQSDSVTLKSAKTDNQLKFHFEGFPFLGIWAAKDADFVCIEPWCGIADSVAHNRNLEEKEGINALAPTETFERTWKVEIGNE